MEHSNDLNSPHKNPDTNDTPGTMDIFKYSTVSLSLHKNELRDSPFNLDLLKLQHYTSSGLSIVNYKHVLHYCTSGTVNNKCMKPYNLCIYYCTNDCYMKVK